MVELIPNTVIYDRFLLIEEISKDSRKGQRVWSVLDQQNGQPFLVHFYSDGRTEWFNDNRQQPGQPSPPPQPGAQAGKPGVVTAVETGRSLKSILPVILVVGLAAAGYLFYKPVIGFVKSSFSDDKTSDTSLNQTPVLSDSLPSASTFGKQESADTTAVVTEPVVAKPPVTEPVVADPVVAQGNTTGPAVKVSVAEALRTLKSLGSIPKAEQGSAFAAARAAFTELKASGGNPSLLDSIYIMCAGKGARSLLDHQKTGDITAKQYAVEWYETAYVLKPSPGLLERLGRLKNGK